jgi:hypothetical protein
MTISSSKLDAQSDISLYPSQCVAQRLNKHGRSTKVEQKGKKKYHKDVRN